MSGILIEHFHGAATRVPADATAFPHREPGFNLLVISEWTEPAENDQNIAWARAAYDSMAPFTGGGRYVNYLGDEEGEGALEGAFGPNYTRLRQVKRQYDPANLFHQNQNIPPA
jgi:FAD/FMN-containing dehydrogenase